MDANIIDNGASIKITIDKQVRTIAKSQIVEIAVIKTNIIKIDIRMGALYNIYIPFANVTNPITANPEALRDAINALLPVTPNGGMGIGSATETKQNQEIDLLDKMNTGLLGIKDLLAGIEDKTFNEPLLVDDSGVGIIYKGFAAIGTQPTDSTWAIQHIERKGETNIITWANGDAKLVNRWADRETLKYI